MKARQAGNQISGTVFSIQAQKLPNDLNVDNSVELDASEGWSYHCGLKQQKVTGFFKKRML